MGVIGPKKERARFSSIVNKKATKAALLLMAVAATLHFESREFFHPKERSAAAVLGVPSKPGLPAVCTSAISTITAGDVVKRTVKEHYDRNGCAGGKNETGLGKKIDEKCGFAKYGEALLQEAMKQGTFLLTVQVGGMDGYSNDPMYKMFHHQGMEALQHWLPVAFEPVQANFDELNRTYTGLKLKGVPCPLLRKRAINYIDVKQKECIFCQFDVSDDAPEHCKNKPDWMRLQIGTLQCDWSRKFFHKDFDSCVIQAPVECGPMEDALQEHWGISPHQLAGSVLQMDVEGYESVIFNRMFGSLPPTYYPPVIHFEQKVLKERDRQKGTNTHESLLAYLRGKGYLLFDMGEDILGLLLPSES